MSDELKKRVHERLIEELVERLRQGVMPRQATHQSLALAAFVSTNLVTGKRYENPAERRHSDGEKIQEQRAHGWTGLIKIKGAVRHDGAVRWAEAVGVEPDFYRMYAQMNDNTVQWLHDYPTEQQAKGMAERLAQIFSMMTGEDSRESITNGARKAAPLKAASLKAATSADSAARFLQIMLDRQRGLHGDP